MSIGNDPDLNRFTISVYDFEKAIEFLREAAKQPPEQLLLESLLICSVIYYCRPFSSNERKPADAVSKISIDAFSDISEVEREVHDRCVTIRNKALAHAEWEYYPTRPSLKTNVISSQRYTILSEPIDWSSLLTLAEKLLEQCHHRRAAYLRSRQDNMIVGASRPAEL